MADREQYPNCFGPYLRYAIDSDFQNFTTDLENFGKRFLRFDENQFRLPLLVELKGADVVSAFETAMGLYPDFGAEFGPDVGHTRYATMRCHKAAVTDRKRAFPIWDTYVSRVELSLPVEPLTKELIQKADIDTRYDEGVTPPGSLLIGILDDGCPFAAAQFLLPGTHSTRVRAIWDQNQNKLPVTIGGRDFGKPLTDFNYGLEYRRDFSSAPGQIGLDEWITLHSSPTYLIDEDSCYADGGFTSLKYQEAHGAHVMDVLAGLIPVSSRLGPAYPGDRRDPPTWKVGTDDASSAEVVFVQFADDNIRDATGVWLPFYALTGIQYILSFAKPYVTKKVIINLSYGPTTGPHDGLAELESALTDLVAEYDGTAGKPKLEIALAAGNSYLTEGHVVYRHHHHDHHHHHVEWTWRLPPDNPVLCFAEVWMKTVHAGPVTVSLTSPSGVLYTSTAVAPAQSPAGVGGPTPWGSDDTVWRLEVKPTLATAPIVAEHGDYTISVTGIEHHASVHAYVARTDPNMNTHTGAQASHFVDPEWERTHAASASYTRVHGEFDNAGSLISRMGTLNGIATAKDSSVHVAGGYIILDGHKSTYSSAGPARNGPLTRRLGPDYLLPCDESYALQGILAGGTRSGSVFRLIGTSTAAPQLARWVVGPSPLPYPTHIPSPGHTVEIEKRGGGDLAPP
jgi:hypothetical protein